MADPPLRVVNATRATVLAERADLADSFLARVRGLLGRLTLALGEGLVIRPCNAVHTLGMAFPIDVIHLGWCSYDIAGFMDRLPRSRARGTNDAATHRPDLAD